MLHSSHSVIPGASGIQDNFVECVVTPVSSKVVGA